MTVLMPLKDQSAAKLSQNNLAAEGGHYLLGANRHWHGGMHFTINKPVQAIADGKLIAYRLSTDYITANLRDSNDKENRYSNSFALIQHESKIKGRALNYYSLYMHLMPASGYKAKPDMAIPNFIRALEGSDRDASITTSEDSPSGLNIRHLKTGAIVTTVPVFGEVSLDESIYTESETTCFNANLASNADYKKVSFVDHKGKTHTGYALLDAERAKQEGDKYIVIVQEDPLKSSDARGLEGLNLRSEQNYSSDTIIQVLKKDTKVKIKTLNTQWAEVKEIDGAAPSSTAFIAYSGNVKFDENDIDEGLLDKVHCPNQLMKSGDLLGNPGLNFSQRNSLHFEIFTDDSIIEFIKDHENLDLSDKNILQVNKGSHLFQRKKIDVAKAIASIDKYSRIKIEDDASSEYVKITATDVCGVVKRTDMDGYDSSSNQYKGIKANLEKYQSKISADLAEGSRLEFIYYSNGAGDLKTADTHDGHRLVAFPIAESDQKTYWVKRDLINSQNIATDDVVKGTILFNSLNTLFPENPIKFIFQEETASGSSDETLVDLATTNSCQDSDGDTWYEVKLPFDDKGVLHYLGVLLGVNRTAQEKGWVKASDTELTTALNWPGFRITKEDPKEVGSKDAKIDFKNLTGFFKELFEDIDTSGDGAISAKEMKAALKDSVLADRLSRVIAKHPSEWQADPGLSKWQYLKDLVPDDEAFEEAKTQIKNLAWWDDAQCAGADLPMSPEVYHLHPLSVIEQLNKLPIRVELIITRFAQYPKKPSFIGIDDNAAQGGTHSKFELRVNNVAKLEGFMLEAAGPSSKDAGSDQRIMPGTYGLIENPGSKGDFRLVQKTKEDAEKYFGSRSLVNIHIANSPQDIEGCFAPGAKAETINPGRDIEYPAVSKSGAKYKLLKDIILSLGNTLSGKSYDGKYTYNEVIYANVDVIVKEQF